VEHAGPPAAGLETPSRFAGSHMMRLEHIAIWTPDLQRLRTFYERYFDARANDLYRSRTRAGYSSHFMTLPDGGGRIELMTVADLASAGSTPEETRAGRSGDVPGVGGVGYAHLAISVGSRLAVEELTARMRADGVRVVSEPRETGDGYYEAVIADPDGNLVEISA
jgi:lactoylglutathione lyase